MATYTAVDPETDDTPITLVGWREPTAGKFDISDSGVN